ncbi:unnamed protein product [Rodentolepis nana]|uniref:Secreted protein n=1 Tax=Rodentolepis nana TaxID=102285 RepID=A0A0R3TP43_RODNA|nr:unnamed protein product [Rodentolepis nana]
MQTFSSQNLSASILLRPVGDICTYIFLFVTFTTPGLKSAFPKSAVQSVMSSRLYEFNFFSSKLHCPFACRLPAGTVLSSLSHYSSPPTPLCFTCYHATDFRLHSTLGDLVWYC